MRALHRTMMAAAIVLVLAAVPAGPALAQEDAAEPETPILVPEPPPSPALGPTEPPPSIPGQVTPPEPVEPAVPPPDVTEPDVPPPPPVPDIEETQPIEVPPAPPTPTAAEVPEPAIPADRLEFGTLPATGNDLTPVLILGFGLVAMGTVIYRRLK